MFIGPAVSQKAEMEWEALRSQSIRLKWHLNKPVDNAACISAAAARLGSHDRLTPQRHSTTTRPAVVITGHMSAVYTQSFIRPVIPAQCRPEKNEPRAKT